MIALNDNILKEIESSYQDFFSKRYRKSEDDEKQKIINKAKVEAERSKAAKSISNALKSKSVPEPSFLKSKSENEEVVMAIAISFLIGLVAFYIGKTMAPHAKKAIINIVNFLKREFPPAWEDAKRYTKMIVTPEKYKKDQEEKDRIEAERIRKMNEPVPPAPSLRYKRRSRKIP